MKVRDHPPKTWFSLVSDGFFVHFSVGPSSKRYFFGRPSWERPYFKTAKHAISRVCPSFFGKSRGASDSEYLFVFHVSWELLPFVIQHFGYFVISECLEPGSFHSKMAFFLELSTGKLQKCKKTQRFWNEFLKFVPASIWNPKIVKNWVLFRKHRILRNIIKTHVFS